MVILRYRGFPKDGTPWIPSSSTSSSSSEEPSDSSGATSAGVSGRLFTIDGAGPGASASCCWAYSSNLAYCFRPLCFLLFFFIYFPSPAEALPPHRNAFQDTFLDWRMLGTPAVAVLLPPMVLPPPDGAAAVVAPEREALAYPSALAVGRAQFQLERGVFAALRASVEAPSSMRARQ